jgi:hypothetical protein
MGGAVRKDINICILRQLILGILEHMVIRCLFKGERYDLLENFRGVSDLVIHEINNSKNS